MYLYFDDRFIQPLMIPSSSISMRQSVVRSSSVFRYVTELLFSETLPGDQNLFGARSVSEIFRGMFLMSKTLVVMLHRWVERRFCLMRWKRGTRYWVSARRQARRGRMEK